MKFDYKRENITLEAYGKSYPIPTKTAALVDAVTAVQKKLGACKNALETVRATKEGIAVFIGNEETERIFPAEKEAEIDTDELSAFWLELNSLSNKATREIIEKYNPRPISKK